MLSTLCRQALASEVSGTMKRILSRFYHHQRKPDTINATGSLASLDSRIFEVFEHAFAVNFVLDLREQLFSNLNWSQRPKSTDYNVPSITI